VANAPLGGPILSDSISSISSRKLYPALWDHRHGPGDPDPNPMLALRHHSSLSSIPAFSFTKGLPRMTKLTPKQTSSKAITRLRQLHRQIGAAGSRSFSTDTPTSSSTFSHMDSGKSSSLFSPQTETEKQSAKKQSGPVDSSPVLFKSEFAARRYVLNKPSALNALNHDMIKMIKEKVDVRFIFICFSSSICYAGL
jgi:hypothetical protein